MAQIDQTKTSIFGYPDSMVPPKQKGKDWCLQYVKACHGQWIQGGSTFPLYNRQQQIIRNRQYADGNQSASIYKPLLTSLEKDKSYLNIDWQIAPILPKFLEIILGYYKKLGEQPTATAVDEQSVNEKRQYKAWLQMQVAMKNEMAWLNSMLGQPQEQDVPSNMDEVEMIMTHNYKQNHEVMLEEGLSLIASESDLHEEIKDQFLRSCFVDSLGILKRYKDVDGRIKARPVDTLEALLGFSKRRDGKDIDVAGEFVQMTLGELRRNAGDAFTITEYRNIAMSSANKYGNGAWSQAWSMNYYAQPQFGDFPWWSWRVRVLDLEWLSCDRYTWKKTTSKTGKKYFDETNNDYIPKGDAKKIQKDFNVWYKSKWIVGTDYIYDWGVLNDQLRNKDNMQEGHGSYYVYRPYTKSPMERVIPYANQIQLALYRMQAAICKGKPAGVAVDVASLENIMDGDRIMKPLEIMAYYNESGNVLFRSVDPDDPSGRLHQQPFTELEGGVGKIMNDCIEAINHNLNMIRETLGVSIGMDGTVPPPRTGVGTAEMARTGTDNLLLLTYSAWLITTEELYNDWGDMLTRAVKDGDYTGYAEALGSTLVNYVKITSDISNRKMGIRVTPLPTDAERQVLQGYIDTAVQQRMTTGAGGITVADAFAVEDAMKTSMKRAQFLLEQRINKNKREDMQAQMQLAKSKANNDQQSAGQASNGRIQETQASTQGQAQLQAQKAELEIQIDNNRFKNDAALKQMEIDAKSSHIEQEALNKQALEKIKV